MRRHWRVYVWLVLWLVPLPFVPDVLSLYWAALVLLAGWVVRAWLVMEPRWSIDDELAEIESWT